MSSVKQGGKSEQGGQFEQGGQPILWLELFFDLVVVAAMVVLATVLEEHARWSGIGTFAVTFAAIWMTWSSFALYVNVASEQAERRVVLMGMAGIAVMAACLVDLAEHANTFAVAFVLCRLVSSRASLRTGRLLTGWPLAQLGGYTLPWIASLWVPAPWKYGVWAAALLLDLVVQIVGRDLPERIAQVEARAERDRARGRVRPSLVPTAVREHHLLERFGTFVIIVLGESVLQLVRATSETPWSAAMWSAAGAGFMILVLVWRLTFAYGFSAGPGTGAHGPGSGGGPNLRVAMPVHLVLTGSLVVLAASLGEMVRHTEHEVDGVWGWIAAGSLAVYLATTLVSALLGGAPRRWVWGWGVPCFVVALVLGLVSSRLEPSVYVWLLLLRLVWLVIYGRLPRG